MIEALTAESNGEQLRNRKVLPTFRVLYQLVLDK